MEVCLPLLFPPGLIWPPFWLSRLCPPTEPATTPIERIPQDYVARVKATHEAGGYGSIGYGYNWKTSEAEKNLLRTHTTAVSSKMLYKLAQDGFK